MSHFSIRYMYDYEEGLTILKHVHFWFLVVGDGPSYDMHGMIEANFHVRLGFPNVGGEYQIRVVGRPMNILKAIDFIGKLADDNYIAPSSGVMKSNPDYSYERDKQFCCPFCYKFYKFGVLQHCETQHASEPQVAAIAALKPGNPERARLVMVNHILFYSEVFI